MSTATHQTYTFRVFVEPVEDQWHAYCPALKKHGAVTCGDTREQALRHIQEVVEMIVEELIEEGVPIPDAPPDEVTISPESRVVVTV
ncbi:MAG: type II toxin-antitoxin system HicB family antitoxin [Candidatus Poribacteria bacterium]|nr:type II toxin-antitoxin system HicB family antitoxin [Candidatus Poribacteria bacterium]